jgi:hypothetical protein
MTLMRVVAAMAWSDGNLATEEVDLMIQRFSGLFAQEADQRAELEKELRDYLMQNIPLEELVPGLPSQVERELVLQLAYEVISSSARTPEEALINPEEAEAYQRLLHLLDLPAETVAQVEAAARASLGGTVSIVDSLTHQLQTFFQGQS